MKRQNIGPGTGWAVWVGVMVAVIAFHVHVLWAHRHLPVLRPADVEPEAIQRCYFHRVTGLACPLCGLTRSSEAFLRLRWQESWRLHPAGAALSLSMLVLGAMAAWSLRPGTDGRLTRPQHGLLLAIAVILPLCLISAWVLRLVGGAGG